MNRAITLRQEPDQGDDGRNAAHTHKPQVSIKHLKLMGDIGFEVGDILFCGDILNARNGGGLCPVLA